MKQFQSHCSDSPETKKGNDTFTLPDSASDKVSDSDNITAHSYGAHISTEAEKGSDRSV